MKTKTEQIEDLRCLVDDMQSAVDESVTMCAVMKDAMDMQNECMQALKDENGHLKSENASLRSIIQKILSCVNVEDTPGVNHARAHK